MSPEEVVSHFDKVRKTGEGRWMACCPVHGDKHPSMSIKTVRSREGQTTLLIRCFVCGADIGSICSAVGLEISDLYPDSPKADYRPHRRQSFNAHDVLSALSKDTLFLHMVSRDMKEGKSISETDMKRLDQSLLRIAKANEYIN